MNYLEREELFNSSCGLFRKKFHLANFVLIIEDNEKKKEWYTLVLKNVNLTMSVRFRVTKGQSSLTNLRSFIETIFAKILPHNQENYCRMKTA